MEEVFKLLKSKYRISKITINNFTSVFEELSIDIYVFLLNSDLKKIHFSKVKNISMDGRYGSSDYSSILIYDKETLDLDTDEYLISIGDDLLTFYCDEFEIQ